MCHALFMGGSPHRKDFFIEKNEDQLPATLNAVEGRLGFQYDVDHRFDERSSADRLKNRTSRDKTFHAFLLYKIFMANQRPLIITEGDTDKVYLECSAKALRPNDPRFIVPSAADPVLAFNVLNRGKRLAQVMGWTGGTGPIQNALIGLKLFKTKYPAKPNKPVIILVDNDQGCKTIFSVIKENYSVEIKHDDESDFFKLADGLYLIKTPHVGKRKMTYIESFLPANALAHKIGGRSFSSSNEYNKRTHFGKADMAKFVSNNRISISFIGYSVLLQRIEAALIDAGF
jgi:RNA-directed DNA polymerase